MGIRNTIPCHEIKTNNLRDAGDGITEWQTIEIPLNKKEKLRVTNMYIPSERTGDTRNSGMDTVVTTRHWPSSIHDLIAGDLNAHSLEWDATLQTKGNHRGIERRRGDTIERWLADKDMVCLNTGKPTHTNRRVGKESTPDVSIVHYSQMDKYTWEVLEELGGSDHKMILITRQAEDMKQVNTRPLFKWNMEKADFVKYSQQVEEQIPRNRERRSLKKLEKYL